MSLPSPRTSTDESRHRLIDALEEKRQGLAHRSRGPSLHVTNVVSFALGGSVVAVAMMLLLHIGILTPSKPEVITMSGPALDVPFTTTIFQENLTYSERPTDDSDYAWNKLIPPGRGFVFVSEEESGSMPPGQMTDSGQIYSVAMFHQLHCLAQIRQAHWILLDGLATGDDAVARSYAGRDGSHVHHCLDYLRQSIMCAGDMTLEWPKQTGPGEGIAVDGWGVSHQCRDWDVIETYMAEKHFNDSMSAEAAG